MAVSLAEMLLRDDEPRESRDGSVLLRTAAVLAIGSFLLFGVGRTLVAGGPLNDFSSPAAELGSTADLQ